MAKSKGKKSRKKSAISVDFTGVEASSRSIEDGVYLGSVKKIEEKESSDDQPYLTWTWEIQPKKGSKVVVFDNTSLQPQALWRLRLLLESIGEEIPDGVMDLDTDSYIGREAKLQITNEKYDGKDIPRISGFISIDGEEKDEEEEENEEDEDEDEKPAKKSKKSSKDEEDEDDDNDDDGEEEEEEDEKPKKGKKSKKDDDDEEEEEEDEDEDEDDEPKKGKKSKIKVGSKVKFKDEKGKTVKGVVIKVNDDTVQIEDGDDEEWEVETDDVTVL